MLKLCKFVVIMKKLIIYISILLFTLFSCAKKCECGLVVYESNIQNNYEWTETGRESYESCKSDMLSSTFLDENGNISYVNSIVECED